MLGGLGAQGRWLQPLQQQGGARWRTIQSWPSTVGKGGGNRVRARDVAQGLPPMVERTVPTDDVGRVGDDDMAIGVAKGDIAGAKALSPEGGNISAVLRLATSRCCPMPAISWHCISTANTGMAISAAVESHARPTASLLLADLVAGNAVAHLVASTPLWRHSQVPFSGRCTLPTPWNVRLPHGNVAHWPMLSLPKLQRGLQTPGNNAHQQEASLPTLQRALPLHSNIACWPMLFPPMLQHIQQSPVGNAAPWPTLTPPSLQPVPPTLGDVAPRPNPFPLLLQQVPHTFGNVAPQPKPTPPMPQRVPLTLSNVVPQPTPLLPMPKRIQLPQGNVACWQEISPQKLKHVLPTLPMPLLLQLPPVAAAPHQAPHTRSTLSCVGSRQEGPHIAVAVKSFRQASCVGGGGTAIRRWFVRPSFFDKRSHGVCAQHTLQVGNGR